MNVWRIRLSSLRRASVSNGKLKTLCHMKNERIKRTIISIWEARKGKSSFLLVSFTSQFPVALMLEKLSPLTSVRMWWSEEGIELSGLVRLRGFPALLLRISIKCKIVEDLATMQYTRLFLSRRVSNWKWQQQSDLNIEHERKKKTQRKIRFDFIENERKRVFFAPKKKDVLFLSTTTFHYTFSCNETSDQWRRNFKFPFSRMKKKLFTTHDHTLESDLCENLENFHVCLFRFYSLQLINFTSISI